MKPRKNPFHCLQLFAIPAIALLATDEAQAVDRYWDQNAGTSGMGGTGDWNTTSSFWRTGAGADTNGGTLGTWVNFATDSATNAILSGTSGTLSTTSAIATNKVTVTSGSFIINDGTGGSFSFNGNNRAISVSSGASLRLDRNMSTSGVAIAISGGGTTTFTASNRAYGGTLNVTGSGTKVIISGSNGLDNNSSSSHSFGSGTTLQLAGQTNYRSTLTINGATLELNTSQGFVTQNGFNLSVTGAKSSVTSLLANTGTANADYGAIGGNGGTAGTITVASTSHVSGVDLEYSAGWRNGTMGKAGAGTLRLNAGFIMNQDNNYTTFDNAGTALNITAGTFLNEGLVKSITNVNGSTSVLKTASSSGTFDQVNVTSGVFEVSRSSGLFTTGLTYATGNNALNLRGGTLQYVGINTDYSSQMGELTGASLINTNGQNVTFASDLTGTGTISKTGSGVLTLSGDNSFGSGALTFGSSNTNRGYIRLMSDNALGNTNTIDLAGTQGGISGLQLEGGVTISQNLTTQGRSNSDTTGYVLRNLSGNNTWNGSVTITAGGGGYGLISDSGTLTLGGNIQSTFVSSFGARGVSFSGDGSFNVTGDILGGGPNSENIAVSKSGAGTLTLGGTNNTYTGATNINAGTLALTSTASLGNTSTTIAGVATLTGGGSFGGAVTINGTHAPGFSPGTQTFGAGLSYGSTSTLGWELTGNTTAGRGTSYDAVDVTGGSFTLNSAASLDLAFSSGVDFLNIFWASSQQWLVVDLNGATAADSNLFTLSGITGGLNYSPTLGDFGLLRQPGSTSENSVYLTWTPVPEPSVVILGSLGLLALLRRRHRGVRPPLA
ncbi:MAG: autotransporter-associated beta strand repeat-containing protein [Akkermansiaceae bacterium]